MLDFISYLIFDQNGCCCRSTLCTYANLRRLILVPAVDADERGDLVLKRTKDLGKTFATIHEDIYSFGYIGAFLFFSVMEDPVNGGASTRPPIVAGRHSLNI